MGEEGIQVDQEVITQVLNSQASETEALFLIQQVGELESLVDSRGNNLLQQCVRAGRNMLLLRLVTQELDPGLVKTLVTQRNHAGMDVQMMSVMTGNG